MRTVPHFLQRLLDVALNQAKPSSCLPNYLDEIRQVEPLPRRILVLGAGKASAEMARVVEEHWAGSEWGQRLTGLVLTRDGHSAACRQIEIVEASHPVPDARGQQTAQRILELASSATEDDLVLFLVSGGGSALLALPAPGLTLKDKQEVNRALLQSGATIGEMNCVRKHLSAIKGGRLAAAIHPARLWTLAISDVPGDDLSVIASGPTVLDPSTFADALEILQRYQIQAPSAVQAHLERGAEETPKPNDPSFRAGQTRLIATPQQMLEAVAGEARKMGIQPWILSDRMEGEAREVAKVQAAIVQQVLDHSQPLAPPVLLLSGGETTVTVRGNGKGGRNTEFMLSLLQALQENLSITAMAVDTDGVDGTENNAGAWIDSQSWSLAQQLGLRPLKYLGNNDAYTFFSKLEQLIVTGPTLTNVNDFRAILVGVLPAENYGAETGESLEFE